MRAWRRVHCTILSQQTSNHLCSQCQGKLGEECLVIVKCIMHNHNQYHSIIDLGLLWNAYTFLSPYTWACHWLAGSLVCLPPCSPCCCVLTWCCCGLPWSGSCGTPLIATQRSCSRECWGMVQSILIMYVISAAKWTINIKERKEGWYFFATLATTPLIEQSWPV